MNLRICFKIINTTPSKFVCKRVEASKYEMEREEYKDVQKALKKIVEGISYNNAVRYFGFQLETK